MTRRSSRGSLANLRILGTARHPGAAHVLAALIAATPQARWTVAASDAGHDMMSGRYAEVLEAGRLLSVPGVNPRQLLTYGTRLLAEVQPDLVVRTTPSVGVGLDELIATASSGRVPVLALQDFPGLGLALGSGEHPLASMPVDLVATVDAPAAALVRGRCAVAATAVGWVAHERFLAAPAWTETRSAVRSRIGIGDVLVVLVIGGSGETPAELEEDMLVEAAGLIGGAVPRTGRLAYRPHPRRRPAERNRLRRTWEIVAGDGALAVPHDVSEAEFLALPDVVVSRASVMNLEAMAYAATAQRPDLAPVSVFYGQPDGALFPGYWGPRVPSTHAPAGGSVIAAAGELSWAVADVLHAETARVALATTAASRYQPRGCSAERALRSLVDRAAGRR